MFLNDYRIRNYEVDTQGSLQPVALINYMQDSAAAHAAILGVSVQELYKRNLAWVLSRLHLQIRHDARCGDTVQVRTWPSSREGHFTCREFSVIGSGGREIAAAATSWAAVNINTRRPVKLEESLPYYPLNSVRSVEDNFATLPQPAACEAFLNIQVCRSHLDVNSHVNNSYYAGWALDTVPEEVARQSRLCSIEISFRAEALYGDTVISRCARDASSTEICYIHQIISGKKRELARVRTRWEHRVSA